MAILVTGGAGYIGSHTLVELLKQDYEVVVVDNFSNSNPEVLIRIQEITEKKFKFYELDLKNDHALNGVFVENKIDAVIHLAGLKSVGESVSQPIKYYHDNLTNALILFEIMQKHGIKKLVFSSSATVYGMHNEPPLLETSTLSATNPYGYTKLMLEQILKDIYVSDNGWSIALLRYFNPIGAHPSGRIGEDPKGIPNNLMPYVTQVAVGKRECLSVFGDDYETHDGTGVRDYIHVVDLAQGHLKALDHIMVSEGIDAFNLGTGVGYSVLDVIKSFEAANGIAIPYKIQSRRPGDIASCYAEVSKAFKILGWKTQLDLNDMCRDAWRWQKKNPNGYKS